MDARGAGMLISASRSVLYASSGTDYAEAARAEAALLRDAIDAARQGG
jgi:orotidine-5'-phosphate decarboxylase